MAHQSSKSTRTTQANSACGSSTIPASLMFSTQGYSSKASAQNAIDSIKKNGPDAPTEDNS